VVTEPEVTQPEVTEPEVELPNDRTDQPPPLASTFEEIPRRRVRHRRRRRWPLVLLGILVVLVIMGAVTTVWVRHQINPGEAGAQVQLTIPQGTSTSDIAALLERDAVISNATVFKVYLRVKNVGTIQAGDYTLRRHQPYAQIVAVLHKGPAVTVDRITIPEGFTFEQIAERVGRLPGRSAQRFIDLAASGQVRSQLEPPGSNNLEGLLYPDTYFVTAKDDEAAILKRMVTAFEQQAVALGIDDAAARLKLTPYQVVIVASMVEREAKVDGDRGKIASVIYNRLGRHMKLGIDATLLYALHGDTAELAKRPNQDNPYNTRVIDGLPPTPIASPGRPSLQAAMNPEQTDYLYYVLADKDGHHAFTASAQEFDKLVADARKKGLL
jgi:UPF0755 protein